nr:hypothetical protein [Lactobacillus paragasseri]
MQQNDLTQAKVLNMAIINIFVGVLSESLKIKNLIIQELFFI